MNKLKIALSLALITVSLFSCKPKFTKLKSGLEYMIIKDEKGDKLAKEGNIVSFNFIMKIKDSVIQDSYKMNGGQPIIDMVQKPTVNGDPIEGFKYLSAGDSAVFRCLVDSLFKNQLPPFAKSGDKVTFYVKMISVKTQEEYQKEQEVASKEKESASKEQMPIDDKLIQEYLKKNNINAQKTASGLYFVITQPGTGANPSKGQEVSMNYTGTLLDGTKFDSNEDPKFSHVETFKFKLGTGQVIKGWDEGIALLNKGAKATLIVPSPLAYGKQEMPGNPNNPKGIPANSVLIFNVQMLDAK
jgi:FKBP-type peptidyl-prolyl cis-trans isomerase